MIYNIVFYITTSLDYLLIYFKIRIDLITVLFLALNFRKENAYYNGIHFYFI